MCAASLLLCWRSGKAPHRSDISSENETLERKGRGKTFQAERTGGRAEGTMELEAASTAWLREKRELVSLLILQRERENVCKKEGGKVWQQELTLARGTGRIKEVGTYGNP